MNEEATTTPAPEKAKAKKDRETPAPVVESTPAPEEPTGYVVLSRYISIPTKQGEIRFGHGHIIPADALRKEEAYQWKLRGVIRDATPDDVPPADEA